MRASSAARALLAASALAVLLAPAAAAQLPGGAGAVSPTLVVGIVDPGQELVPERPTTLLAQVDYSYSVGGYSPDPIAITLEIAKKPEWMDARLEPSVVYVNASPTGVGGNHSSIRVFVNTTVHPDAPGLAHGNLSVKASSKSGGNLASAERTSPELPLRVGAVSRLNVTAPERVTFRGGLPVGIPFLVKNLGNYASVVQLSVTTRPQNSIVELPASITLPRGTEATVLVKLRTPWVNPERGVVVLEAQGLLPTKNDIGKPDPGELASASVEVEGRALVPAPGLALAVAAAAFAAVALRRRA